MKRKEIQLRVTISYPKNENVRRITPIAVLARYMYKTHDYTIENVEFIDSNT